VRLAYVDESYTSDLYFVAAVVVDDACASALGPALDDVVIRASQRHPGVKDTAELHGHSIFHGKDDWTGLPPRARINIYDQVMRAIGDHRADVFLRGIDRNRQAARYSRPDPPHDVVLQHLLERLNDFGRRLREPVLVIADEIHEHDRHRSNLRDFRQFGTPGYRSSTLPMILDTLHFVPSKHSRLIQAADMVAFLHCRRRCRTDTDPRAQRANDLLWSRIGGRIRHQGTWHP
jgi:hypothetical protein